MSKFGSKEDLLKSVQALFESMERGKLSAEELESLVEHTRELHERALILRYKAYEEKVFGAPEPKAEEPELTEERTAYEHPEVTAENEIAEPEEETLPFEPAGETSPELTREPEQPVFDFALFDEPEPVSAPSEVPEIASYQFGETPDQPSGNQGVYTEEKASGETPEEPESIAEVFPTLEENEPEEEAPENEQTAESGSEAANTLVAESVAAPPSDSLEPVFRRMLSKDDSLGARLMSPKLTTLVGSFGLNEKLQCIHELFRGSGEEFNEAIHLLDTQAGFPEACRILTTYARENHWDLESKTVVEFVQKIERRY